MKIDILLVWLASLFGVAPEPPVARRLS